MKQVFPKIRHFLFLSVLFLCIQAYGKETFHTEPRLNGVHSLLVRNVEEWMRPPVINLGTDEQIEISFDEFSLEYRNLYYEIIHCNADWTRSDITELNYLEGFNRIPLRDYATSFNTWREYTHYSLYIPNEDVSLKVSGNYAVKIYDSNTDEVLAMACFSVIEGKVAFTGRVVFDTDIAFRKDYQQLEFTVSYPEYNIRNPLSEVFITVAQNRRLDNAVMGLRPTFVQNNRIVFQNNRDLIFEAGNEFRRFEMSDKNIVSLGVNRIDYVRPYYQVELQQPVRDRLESGYIYTPDLNGRSFVKRDDASDGNVEADYFMVHFDLPVQRILEKGDMYVIGEFTNYLFNDFCRMAYDDEGRCYRATIPMKQGVYDYMYVFVPDGESKATTAFSEGNYYQTDNEYLVMVYHRPPGSRYDKLVGYTVLQNTVGF